MTGIERLHKLIADIDVSADPELWYILRGGTEGDWDCEEHDDKTLDSTLAAIADQIEREQGGRVSRMRVLAVVTDMERHVSGVEGAEDSPVARWARELREALGGNGRDPAADVSVSACDLLPADEREAIAWVREHGGLGAVKRRWECLSYYADPVPRSCMEKRLARLQRQIDESHAALRRRNQRIEELTHRVGDLTTENAELRRRAERVKRPAAPAADGKPLEVGQTVYATRYGYVKCTVLAIEWDVDGYLVEVENEGGCKFRQTPDEFTHTKPEPPDSWERIEDDATLSPEVYCHRNGIDISQKDGTEIYLADTVEPMASDLVRRCKALAEKESRNE